MMSLISSITEIPSISKNNAVAIKKLGIDTIQELLFYFPYRYLDFSKTVKIIDVKPGESVTIQGVVKSIESRFSFRSHLSLAEAIVSDDTGSIKITWFNQGYLAKSLQKGGQIFLSGTPEYYKNSLQLTNPIYEKVSDFPIHTARLVPVYRLSDKIYPKTFRNIIAQVLSLAEQADETLPREIIERQNLASINQTIRLSHFPEKATDIDQAKKRLAFEEIFYNQLLAQKHKLELALKSSYAIKFDQDLIKSFLATLPFELTPGQKKSAWEILQDLEKTIPMNRLLEGDVGSGKTLVALAAALEVASAGYQAALLAPTEILANQHYETLKKYSTDNSDGRRFYSYSLFTNNFSKIDDKEVPKTKLKDLISEGMPGIYVGTHALLQKAIKFKNLALVIIDEQHRFGVEQRAQLMKTTNKVPHLLSLSATPIPRTLQLAFYGELDISQIKSKPANRKLIVTKLVDAQNRPKAYEFIANQVKLGRQVFVITPLLGVKAAKSELENLKKIFPYLSVGLMHGRLKGGEKEAVMKEFLENKINILVSTSVVEVGVDVPNASVMMIEGAERFGLAQLHQFRGRVGRAEHQSFCFLFTDNENAETLERLTSFTKTNDGFELAELDLKQRGFGQLYGAQQSGWDFKYFSPAYTSLIQPAREEALNILRNDLELKNYPKLQEKIKGQVIHFE
jgi:ATP-dependent DNA helicase RecG